MISVLPPPPPIAISSPSFMVNVERKSPALSVCSLADSVERFTSLVLSRATSSTVRLFCSYPTECSTDLDDLQELHERALQTLHAVVALLRAHKIYATYSLKPSSDCAVVLSAGQHVNDLTAQARIGEACVGVVGVPVLVTS